MKGIQDKIFTGFSAAASRWLGGWCMPLLLTACARPRTPLFESLPSVLTQVNFVNHVEDSDALGIQDYLYFYNGGGVAIGDINNDGLPDIYLTASKGSNRLYLNKGGCQFEDITRGAGVAGKADWTTGVTMADVNGDGWLDIYVSTVGGYKGLRSVNQLFINNHDLTFSEQAAKWGLDQQGFCTQAAFFDYDRDGDLDMYQLKHSPGNYTGTAVSRPTGKNTGDRLLRNDGDHFTDVTEQSGIYSKANDDGLGITVADIDQDGWDDLYISNDFREQDYYYHNNGNGTFSAINTAAFADESRFSRGADIADINNDGWPDIMTVGVRPANEDTSQSAAGNNSYSRNCLQLNIGTGLHFSDIALYAGVAATGWSWGPLMADFDNDGRKDIFISTGILRRPNDPDYIKNITANKAQRTKHTAHHPGKTTLAQMPSGKWHNYIFQGTDSLVFHDRSADWGLDAAAFSNGAAYADLDNDGDLDLVVNRINERAGIYRNHAAENTGRHYLRIQLKGNTANTQGIGAKVWVKSGGHVQYASQQTVRGFQSSVAPGLLFGLGENNIADSVVVVWPAGNVQTLTRVKADETLLLEQSQAKDSLQRLPFAPAAIPLLEPVTDTIGLDAPNPHPRSTTGARLAVGDMNGDGLDDLFICGARGQAGKMYLQQANGSFVPANETLLRATAAGEDADALLADVDGDKDLDLYVVSGGSGFAGRAPELPDRLYINDGSGGFTKSDSLPALYANKAAVCAADYDKDGDIDLFVAGRANAQAYGQVPRSYLLQNDGNGHFKDITATVPEALATAGSLTAAAWADVDGDTWPDLVVTGEWMSPRIFRNVKGKFTEITTRAGLSDLTGWWQCMLVTDLDGNGAPDIVLGNWGLNSRLKASISTPLRLYIADLDKNGTQDQVLAYAVNGKYYTFLGKDALEKQLPGIIRNRYPTYRSFAGQTVSQVFGTALDTAQRLQASELRSMVLWNNGKGKFTPASLLAPAQWSPVMALYAGDVDMDGHTDIITGGNFYNPPFYDGRYDANAGTFIKGKEGRQWEAASPLQSGWALSGEVRDIKTLRTVNGQLYYVVSRNNDKLLLFRKKN